MALLKGTNSYATVIEADAYFADRLDVSAWTGADSTAKAQALVTATSILDGLTWTGTAVTESQPLAFPRSGEYFDPRVGAYVFMDGTVPSRIELAVKELAHHLLNNDGLMDDTGSVLNLQVGVINLSNVKSPNLVPGNVRRIIKPLLLNSGSRGWWRAN